MVPCDAKPNTVLAVPSPQSTVTFQGPVPGSMKFPRLKDCPVPSLAVWFAGAVTAGPVTKVYSAIWVPQWKFDPLLSSWYWLADQKFVVAAGSYSVAL